VTGHGPGHERVGDAHRCSHTSSAQLEFTTLTGAGCPWTHPELAVIQVDIAQPHPSSSEARAPELT